MTVISNPPTITRLTMTSRSVNPCCARHSFMCRYLHPTAQGIESDLQERFRPRYMNRETLARPRRTKKNRHLPVGDLPAGLQRNAGEVFYLLRFFTIGALIPNDPILEIDVQGIDLFGEDGAVIEIPQDGGDTACLRLQLSFLPERKGRERD